MNSIVAKFDYILEEERRCLLQGDYSLLETFLEKKIKLSDKLAQNAQRISQDSVERIRSKSERNMALIISAQRGLQSAISHLSEATEGTFQSYSKEGYRTPLSNSPSLRQKL